MIKVGNRYEIYSGEILRVTEIDHDIVVLSIERNAKGNQPKKHKYIRGYKWNAQAFLNENKARLLSEGRKFGE